MARLVIGEGISLTQTSPPDGDVVVGLNPNEGTGFIDIGDKRIQWGQFTNTTDSVESVSLNQDFADTGYNVVLTSATITKAGAVAVEPTSVSQFDLNRSNSIDGTIVWNWQAIGNKP